MGSTLPVDLGMVGWALLVQFSLTMRKNTVCNTEQS